MSLASHHESKSSQSNRTARRREAHREPDRERDTRPGESSRSRGESHRQRRPRSRSPRRDYDRGEPARKKRKKSKKDKTGESSSTLNINGASGSASATFDIGEDFVPFAPPSDDEDDRERAKAPEREWDRGKGKGRARQSGRSDGESKRTWRDRDDGDDLVFDDDEIMRNGRDTRDRRAPWVSAVDWKACNNVAEMLHKEVEAYVNYISPTPVEDEIRGLVVELVSKAITTVYKDAQVRAFGSFGTKLYLPQGDIDLVVTSESMAYSNTPTVLQALAATLKRAGITDRVTIIAKAKVPIVKFVTKHGRLNVDISVNQANGLVACDIVNRFLGSPSGGALRGLVLIIKAFLSQRGMNEVYTGGLGSYAIVCLAVSFLQMHPKLRRGEIDASENLGVLVMEFFELYGCYFNYEQTGISVNRGGSYFNKVNRGWQNHLKKGLLSIEDPTDSSNDISRGSFAVAKVRSTFAGAFQILASAAVNRASILRNTRDGNSFIFQGYEHPEEGSILSAIIGVTQETINHRRLIQEVYDDRILHDLLGVEPKISLAPSTTNGHKSRAESEESETDIEMESELEEGEHSRRHRRDESDDEGGRYDIGMRKPPPAKRRRVDTVADTHTVFTTDDEEDGEEREPIVVNFADSGDDLEEYESDGRADAVGDGGVQRDEKRSYWLSKGIGIGTVQDDSD
ncbi:hypothetical protein HWV62_41856 [Athelia sp. TMB]|nr:hypothetical protein HWV62_41856 [Athelia sp. TMB]